MSRLFAYDTTYDPPAAVLPLLVGKPQTHLAVLLPGLVDTGADCTLIPESVAKGLGLPLLGLIQISGVGGGSGRGLLYAATVEIGDRGVLARLAAFGNETIIGRDLLSQIVMLFDGPRSRLRLSPA